MRCTVVFVALVSTLLTLSAGCSGRPKVLGMPCERTHDCPDDGVCYDGVCQAACSSANPCAAELRCNAERVCVPKPTQGKPGVPCERTDQCNEGLFCGTSGVCLNPGTCQETVDCGPQQSCRAGGRCVATGEPCEGSDATCGAGFICDQDVCVRGCRVDDACPASTVCEQQACITGCRNDSACSDLQVCRGRTCVDGCRGDTTCAAGAICRDDACLPGCRDDDGCSGDAICVQDACVPGCRQDSNCVSGQICAGDSGCVPGCRQDNQCGSGAICQNNNCVPGCREDSTCGNERICQNNACVAGCRQDATCGGGQICESRVCVQGCRAHDDCPLSTICDRTACTPGCLVGSDDRCPEGERCGLSGQCLAPGKCADSVDCPSGEVCRDGGTCQPGGCVTDIECGLGRVCDVAARVCEPGCTQHDRCPLGLICGASGLCETPPVCDASASVPCADGLTCHRGRCYLGGGRDCRLPDVACPDGMACDSEGWCVLAECQARVGSGAGSGGTGTGSGTRNEGALTCPDGRICEYGLCVPPCTADDSDDPSVVHCDTDQTGLLCAPSGECVPNTCSNPGIGGATGSATAGDADRDGWCDDVDPHLNCDDNLRTETDSEGDIDAPPHDADCDGVEGLASRAFFVAVSGDDAQPDPDAQGRRPGTTPDNPLRTIGAALSLAASEVARTDIANDEKRDRVYVAAGLYQEQVVLPDGVSLFGGYAAATAHSPGFATRARAHVTTVQANAAVALVVDGYGGVGTVDGMTFASAPGARAGESSMAGSVRGVSGLLVFQDNTFKPGAGAAGAAGMAGLPYGARAPGGVAFGADNPANGGFLNCDTGSNLWSAAGGAGGELVCDDVVHASARGGEGGEGMCRGPGGEGAATWVPGTIQVAAAGGGGGQTGTGAAARGQMGGTAVIVGGLGQTESAAPVNQERGVLGLSVTGVAGAGHLRWSAGAGVGGGIGAPGIGGAGGGAAGGLLGAGATDGFVGLPGGGGGAGGCGGRGGAGGGGGGGSFGLAIDNDDLPGVIRVVQNRFHLRPGGAGGEGGDAGAGQQGGLGADGANWQLRHSSQGSGGRGGDGSAGGGGGCGGGGAGGASAGVLVVRAPGLELTPFPNPSPNPDTDNAYEVEGAGGVGGSGGTGYPPPGSTAPTWCQGPAGTDGHSTPIWYWPPAP